MVTKSSSPNPNQNMVCVHRAISRGLTVAIARGAEFSQAGFPDAELRQGFTDYTQSLTAVLWAHLLGEDELAFPAVQEKLPTAPYDRLIADHQKIEVLIGPVRRAGGNLTGEGEQANLTQLLDGLRQIAAIWKPHIQLEEEHFSLEAFAAVMSAADLTLLAEAWSKHSQQHATPNPLTLPFTLFNLEAEDRALMAAPMPRMVMEELIQKAWKSQWARMRPFLLE